MSVRSKLLIWFAGAALAASAGAASAAVDAFIWFDGAPGDTTDAAHKGAFEIKDFSFGVENPTTIGSATGGAGAGKIKFNEFTIKRNGPHSPLFDHAVVRGARYNSVIVEARKAGGSGGEFLRYKFDTVFTTKVDWSGPGDEGPEESITFQYTAMHILQATQPSTRDWGAAPATTSAASPWK